MDFGGHWGNAAPDGETIFFNQEQNHITKYLKELDVKRRGTPMMTRAIQTDTLASEIKADIKSPGEYKGLHIVPVADNPRLLKIQSANFKDLNLGVFTDYTIAKRMIDTYLKDKEQRERTF